MANRPLLILTALAAGLFSATGLCAHPYAELVHASNAGATDRNLGRNFLQVGWNFDDRFTLSGGVFIAGEEPCFESVSFGKSFDDQRWKVSVIGIGQGICSVDRREVRFERNVGVCLARQQSLGRSWVVGLGACAWARPDYAISDLTNPADPLSTKNDGPQLTAMLSVRFDWPGGRAIGGHSTAATGTSFAQARDAASGRPKNSK